MQWFMHSAHSGRHTKASGKQAKETHGLVLNWGWRYDLMAWFFVRFTFGSSVRGLQQKIVDLAQIRAGEAVLDVGCGTGTMALEASRRVGATGRVTGIDPAPQQLARARRKAARRGLPIDFQLGLIEQLDFPDQSFDVVLSTFMMHHLPDDLKRQGLAEIARVLKPGGCLLVVDMQEPAGPWKSSLADLPALMKEAGLGQVELGETGLQGLGFVRAA